MRGRLIGRGHGKGKLHVRLKAKAADYSFVVWKARLRPKPGPKPRAWPGEARRAGTSSRGRRRPSYAGPTSLHNAAPKSIPAPGVHAGGVLRDLGEDPDNVCSLCVGAASSKGNGANIPRPGRGYCIATQENSATCPPQAIARWKGASRGRPHIARTSHICAKGARGANPDPIDRRIRMA